MSQTSRKSLNLCISAAVIGVGIGLSAAIQAQNSDKQSNKDEKNGDAKASVSPAAEKKVECFGNNACKAKNECGVSKDQIALANTVYKNKFKKSEPNDCAGVAKCAAKKGFLSYNQVDESTCLKKGGFVFEKDSTGKLIIRDKKGIKG